MALEIGRKKKLEADVNGYQKDARVRNWERQWRLANRKGKR